MPKVTRIIIVINVIVHLYVTFLGSTSDASVDSFYQKFGLVPLSFIEGSIFQPFTALFLHYPFFPFHLLINMLGLWSFGSMLERQIGSLAFFWLYFISGLFSSLFVVLIPFLFGSYQDISRPTVGASGALMGLLGAVSILYPNSKLLLLFIPMKTKTATILLGVGSILFSIFDQKAFISHNGHFGGLLGGIIYAWFALRPRNQGITNFEMLQETMRENIPLTEKLVIERSEFLALEATTTSLPSIEDSEQFSSEKIDKKEIDETYSDTPSTGKLTFDPLTGEFKYEKNKG